MFKKNVRLMFVLLLFTLSSVASAISWTGGGGSDHLWSQADNWNVSVPNSVENVTLDKDYLDDSNYVLIDSSVSAECENLNLANNAVDVKMYMTGGSLDVSSDFLMNTGSDGRFSVFEMTGGVVTIGGILKVPSNGYDNPATINLYGGTINAGSLVMNLLHGKIDIQAGVLILDGDVTDAINTLVGKGYIRAFDGLRAVSVDYDITNAGKTTVMAAGDLNNAYGPGPVAGDVGVGLTPILSWSAGDNASEKRGHKVYFGTDAVLDKGEFQGAQTATTFDVRDRKEKAQDGDTQGEDGDWYNLLPDTTYYWRVDEVKGGTTWTGDVWSFTTGYTLLTDYYVAVDGNDNDAGTQAAPWATIQKARDYIRAAYILPDGGVTVWIGGGTYYVAESIVFDKRDSGTETSPIVYKALADEKPVFCGGKEITGWSHDSGNVYKVYLDDVNNGDWSFDQLFHNGTRTRPARIPNSGYLTPYSAYPSGDQTKQFKVKLIDIPGSYDYSQARCVVRGVADFWSVRPIKSIKRSTKVLTLTDSAYSEIINPNWRYFIIGVKEALDGNHDFFLDRETGFLYYYTNSAIENIEIIAPTVDNVFEFKGADVDNPVKHIKLHGLEVWCSKFTGNFDDGRRYLDDSYFIANRPGTPNRKGLIRLENASNITIEQCLLNRGGFNGIAMDFGAQYNTVYNNKIEKCGFYGILMTGRDPGQGVKSDPNEQWYGNHHNTINNNHILKCGEIVYHGGGIFNWQSGENQITYNLIHDHPRCGICFKSRMNNGNYGRVKTTWNNRWAYLTNRGNYVGHNHIHTTCTKTSDTGGLVMTSAGRDNVIDYNRVHKNDQPSNFSDISKGIHLDNAQCYTTVSNNIVYDVRGAAKTAAIIRPSYNTVTNNIMTQSSGTGADWGVIGWKPNYFLGRYNIIAHWKCTNNVLDTQRSSGAMYAFDGTVNDPDIMDESENNVFNWAAGGTHKMKKISGDDTLANWKTLFDNKYDQNSVAADPRFVARNYQNYNLKADSPAWALGFQEIDQNDIGLDATYPVSHSPWPYYGQDKGTYGNLLTWTPNPDADSFDLYLASSSSSVSTADHNSASFKGNLLDPEYAPISLTKDKTYYWAVDDIKNGEVINYGDVWKFVTFQTITRKAQNPSPSNNARNVDPNADLDWSAPTKGADNYDVYFGTSSPGQFVGNQTSSSYEPGPMDYETMYYWRVDANSSAGLVTGTQWSFKTHGEGFVPNRIGWWKFDETTGTMAADSSGYENHGTLENMTNADWVSGYYGNALDFDGSNDRVRLDNDSAFNFTGAGQSWCLWLKTNVSGRKTTVMSKTPASHVSTRGDKRLQLTNSGTLRILANGVTGPVASTGSVNNGAWHHVAVTFKFNNSGSNDAIKIYIDGVRDGGSSNRDIQKYGESGYIMVFGNGPGTGFDGKMDDVRVYDKTLSRAEILAIMADGP